MARQKTIAECGGFEAFLSEKSTVKWKKYHNDRTLFEALNEIRKNLSPFIKEAERGAMAAEIRSLYAQIEKEIRDLDENENLSNEIKDIIAGSPVLYLNNHGEDHISQVVERAEQIVTSFARDELSEFETFILLCAIQIHDIGNVLGRVGHERNLFKIFDEHVKDIIPDTPERRIIKSIAMVHGGKTRDGKKDTISQLSQTEDLFGEKIRTRLLAAILRLADELADDSTRKSSGALELDIVGDSSIIFQDYSRVLHTVKVEKKEFSECHINLVFELEKKDLEKKYVVGKQELFLLDEIYDRTIKMERERRYCQKFMNTEINICAINVSINIYGEYSSKIDAITYRLEDTTYPNEPENGAIKQIIATQIRSGKEELDYVKSVGGDR